MLDKVQSFAEKYNMLPHGASVVCGLSGGADSTCLLLCLKMLSEKIGFSVEAIHVNHCLRGEESDRDEQFCRELCEKLEISFNAVSCDVKGYAETNSLSTEEAARILRYKAFSEVSEGKLIATAHNANDNLETIIFNLTRGSALKGIAGIPPVRDNIIRPLLTSSRAEIEAFLAENGFTFVTDSTNLSDDYTRNKIRHGIIPILRQINASAVETAVNSAEILRSENSFIEAETDKAYSVCKSENKLTGLRNFHEVIRRRCISRLLTENSLPYSFERLSAVDNITLNGGKINVSGEYFLISDGNSLSLTKINSDKSENLISAELILGDNQIFPDKIIKAELITGISLTKSEIINKKFTTYYLDYDKINGKAVLRSRKFGDRIQLYGRNFTSSVKKIINQNIPPSERSHLHFIEDDIGTVFAEKIGISQRVAPDENTARFLKITVRFI